MEMNNNYCVNCGTKLYDGDLYCSNCGKRVVGEVVDLGDDTSTVMDNRIANRISIISILYLFYVYLYALYYGFYY